MAANPSCRAERVRFGAFEVNFKTGEARKHGIRVKLHGQPMQILAMLLERPGEVVTREEIQHRLWSADTFVEFEHSLNTAVKKLRRALGDSADQPLYVETLPRVGYRFIAPVEKQATPGDTAQDSAMLPAVEPWLRWRWPIFLGVGICMVASLGVYLLWSRSRARPQPSAARMMLAVLPFENLTGDASQDYFSDGLTEEMIGQLGQLDPQRLGVIARTSVMHYKHDATPLEQIGRELGVQYALEGSVRRDADRVRISVQLIRVADQTHVWARQYDRELGNLLALQEEITQEVADEIQIALGEPKRVAAAPMATASPNSYETFDLYLKGRYFWNKRTGDGFQQAAEYFQQAIAKDPNYAPAYAGLADTFGLMSVWGWAPQNEFMPKARAAALRALQIDDRLAEAHTSLALIAENYDYDWQTSEKEFRRAIQLDPGYATAHQWYAEHLSWRGRFEEAVNESDRARQLDPLSLIIATDHAWILYYSRQYDRAIQQARTVLAVDPSFARALGLTVICYVQGGRFADALASAENVRHFFGEGAWYWSLLVSVYVRAGQQARARHALEKLEVSVRQLPSQERWRLELSSSLARGRKDEVIAFLQEAYAENSNSLTTLKVDPNYDPLRSDPRFQDLLRRVGLAE